MRSIAAVVRHLARAQQGVVARWQLLEAGVPEYAIDNAVKCGALVVLHRGVYQSGPVLGARGRELAAVLACGGRAFVSHESAAAMLGWRPACRASDPVDVLVPAPDRGHRPGIRLHRVRAIAADETTALDGVPMTTPARTLLDLAGVVGARDVERAIARAERERQVERAALIALIERYPHNAGARRIRALLRDGCDPEFTRSEAEERFLAIVRPTPLRQPLVNVRVEGFEVDFYWPVERLVVEVDGYAFHASAAAFERDRRRDAVLAAAGIRVMRVTWSQIVNTPSAVLVRLAQALAR